MKNLLSIVCCTKNDYFIFCLSTDKCVKKEYCIRRFKLDSSLRFAISRMTFSACYSEVVPEADQPLA